MERYTLYRRSTSTIGMVFRENEGIGVVAVIKDAELRNRVSARVRG